MSIPNLHAEIISVEPVYNYENGLTFVESIRVKLADGMTLVFWSNDVHFTIYLSYLLYKIW